MNFLALKMQPHITVLSHISTDVTQPSLYLTAKNGQKYLIGRIGEGFQRSLAQTKTKTSKLSGVFLSGQVKWKSVSGLPGMLLSFGDRDLNLNKVYCGAGAPFARATSMVESWQNFSFHKPLVVEPEASAYSDENVDILPLTICDSGSYIVKMKPVRGRFNVNKARERGVPPGPFYSELGAGRSVTLPESGQVVHPHEVLGAAPIPATTVVLDLPTMRHVEEAIHHLKDFPASLQGESDLKAVYYFFEEAVDLNSPLIRELISALSSTSIPTRHFISHPDTAPDFNTLTALSEFQSVFRAEFPNHFSPLYSQPARHKLDVPGAEIMERMHVFSVEPRETDTAAKAKKQKVNEIPAPPVSQEPSSGCHIVPGPELTEPEVITLGTGASAPSKYRNVSSTLVRTPNGSVLFDCGEGTNNTLGRLYGVNGRKQILAETRVQYISHMHADHHLGGMQVLDAWITNRKELMAAGVTIPKLLLATPIYFHKFAEIWSKMDGFNSDFNEHVELLDLEAVCFGNRYSAPEFQPAAAVNKVNEELKAKIGPGVRVETCTAKHCPYSYNGAVTLSNGTSSWKMSYSGDSRPNPFFAENIGRDSDLLVHEATHENDLHEEAVKKRHSTINEALQIAQLMRAKNTTLTHISQRYPRLPTLDKDLVAGDGYVYFGFDCMHTKLSQIKDVQQMIPKMSALLESLDQDEE